MSEPTTVRAPISPRRSDRGRALRRLSGVAVAALLLAACERGPDTTPRPPVLFGGEPAAGASLIRSYGCGTCHVIPGIRGAGGHVGPPLTSFALRAYIAGNLSNDPENLVAWIMNPQDVEPGTAMPFLGVSAAEARDIAAYLYTLR